MAEKNKRKNFIRGIGLTHDPFETPVAEQELGRVQDVFYSYHSPPPSHQNELSIETLRQPQHVFIFGDPGNGKSTLRLTLEADCRTVLDGTLATTFRIGENIEHLLSFEEYGTHLAQALIIDLTLAIIEQFNPLDPFPTKTQIQSLQRQIQNGGRQLQRLLRIILEKLELQDQTILDSIWGISKDWEKIGKAPVKYVGGSKELGALLKTLLLVPQEDKIIGWDAFWQGLTVAREWKFKRFLVLIDGVDAQQRTIETMIALITPILGKLHQVEMNDVFLKFFLPLELKDYVQTYLQSYDKDLYSRTIFPIIEWDEKALQQVLTQRFRAASSQSGPWHTGLNELATPNLNLDKAVIQAAGRSPRRLLRIISDLIDIHISHNPDSLKIGREEWEECKRKLVWENRIKHTTESGADDMR